MEQLARSLAQQFGEAHVLRDAPMAAHTSFRVGGAADICFFPGSEEEIAFALSEAKRRGVPTLVMGNGSNLIVRDGGIRGLTVIIGDRFSRIEADGARIRAEAGISLAKVASFALEHALTGLEFASGIPGTLGGGVAMNAGAYGGQMSDVLVSARVLKDAKICTYTREEMEMGYRTTRVLCEGSILLWAEMALAPGDPQEIREKMRDLNARRREKQPLEYPSAGSMFKRPIGYFAGALIEQAKLKGERVGGAMVSEKHAGFIVNMGDATARDVLDLIDRIRARVLAESGVTLEPEVRIVGEETCHLPQTRAAKSRTPK